MSQGVGVVVLCGGRSRRMGRAKASLPFGAESMLERVVRVLSAAGPLVAVAAPEQLPPALVLPGGAPVPVVHDAREGQGPLQGIAAGLEALAPQVTHAFVSATDVPFVRPELVAALVALREDHDVVVPRVDGHFHPLAALYACALHEVARALLAQDQRRPFFLFGGLRGRWRAYGGAELARRGVRKALRAVLPAWALDPTPGASDAPVLHDGRTVAQLRSMTYLLGHLEDAAAKRAVVQARRRRDDQEIFERFPLAVVATYPGDERLFDSPAFGTWLPDDLPVVRQHLDEIMAPRDADP